ncbi:MAG TPA: acyl-CoA dehydrogenase family protein [Cerasibacillus sp.]|uniref:acyl-CoA dehydrogenase family protein n=1 Tax=Cerasibacillus sp. TaxID=2498711 RepID=UPI002F42D356
MSILFKSSVQNDSIFTPEDFDETTDMIARTAEMYAKEKVYPRLEELNDKNFDTVRELMEEAGNLGLIGADIPEEYGGLDLGKVNGAIISEKLAYAHSFSITFGGQTGIGALPIAYFGNDEQKERYLPSILSGENIAAYALTEPSSGTDALSLRTTATLNDEGTHYLISGEKQWITNAGFANIFIVYARAPEGVTAFIVEADSEGLSTSQEEEKMGLEGSSTCSVILDQVKVPKENVIGQLGKGHYIAFNVLNIGRFKISATSLGSAKRSLELALQYGNERKQFQKTLNEFELTQYKIAAMAAQIFAVESVIYRIAGEMQESFEQMDSTSNYAKAIAPYASKCSLSKIIATESLDAIVDEALQIHGGYGYMKEYEIENIYRDVRINRIFEGTNEINRIILAQECMNAEYESFPVSEEMDQSLLRVVREVEKVIIQTIQHFQKEQLVDMNKYQTIAHFIANCATQFYAIESAVLRTEKADKSGKNSSYMYALTNLFIQRAITKLVSESTYLLSECNNAELVTSWMNLLSIHRIHYLSLQQLVAEKLIQIENYSI